MGHELGHYVKNHIDKMISPFALLLLAGFLFARWAMDRMLAGHHVDVMLVQHAHHRR